MADAESPLPTTETSAVPAASDSGNGKISTVTNAQWDAMILILSTIYNYRIDEHDPSKVFQRKVNKRVLPDYYDVIKEPMALSTIKAKVNTKEYKNFAEYVRDFALIPFNAQVYNRPDAGAYQDALIIKDIIEQEFTKLANDKIITEAVAKLPYLGELPPVDDFDPPVEEAEEGDDDDDDDDDDDEADSDDEASRRKKRGRKPGSKKDRDEDAAEAEARKRRGRPPRVDTPMEARIKNIIKGLRKYKNADNQLMVLHFERLPDKADLPDYYAEIKQPIALDTLKKKLKRKKYMTVEQFMKDLELIFENAKQYNVDDSTIYKDAVTLQKEARKLAEEEKKKPDTDFVMEDGRLPMPSGILHNGELWKVGDWVHIQNANDLTKPIVAQIYRTWQDKQGSKWVNACWYYRPEQTIHRFDRHFYEHEVMKTGQYRDHPIDDVIDRCFVMFFTRYNRGRPRNFPQDKEVYVCESRYNEENHKLNKIKTWASCLPDEVRDKDYEMDLYDFARKMKKVPSPIAYLLSDSAKETDDLPKPQWGADNAPPKIGAVHKRPRDPKDSPPPEPTPTPPPPQRLEPARTQSNVSISSANTAAQSPAYTMTGAPLTQQQQQQQQPPPLRTSTQTQPQVQRTNFTPSHPQQYQQSLTTPASYRTAQSPVNQQNFAPPPLTPHASFTQNQQQAYSTPQTYNAASRTSQHNYNTFAQQPAIQYSGSASAGATTTTASLTSASSTSRPYNAPQTPQVYCLGDIANSCIPKEIRDQFQCDESGRMLFFTTPPVLTSAPLSYSINRQAIASGKATSSDRPLTLGHSARYVLAKEKRDAAMARKRKREEEEQAEHADTTKRTKLEDRQMFAHKWADVTAKAILGLEDQLAEWTRKPSGERVVQRELALLDAKWTVQAKRDMDASEREKKRRDRETILPSLAF